MLKSIIIIILAISINTNIQGQTESRGRNLEQKQSQRMEDSLQLTKTERLQIFKINSDIADQKSEVRKKTSDILELTKLTQQIENTRDSLYRIVLPKDKYVLYLEKKTKVLNNN
jgi:predicted Holliday junction resolvase-like endonuclease